MSRVEDHPGPPVRSKSISSIEIPYPFGNGMHVTGCNNFFDMLEIIKTKIDNHLRCCDFDIALISAGAYTPFIAEHVESRGEGILLHGPPAS